MNEDTLQLTQLSKNKVQQLNTQLELAQEALKQYVQGCLDTLLVDQDSKAKWTFNLGDMTFHKVKEKETDSADSK